MGEHCKSRLRKHRLHRPLRRRGAQRRRAGDVHESTAQPRHLRASRCRARRFGKIASGIDDRTRAMLGFIIEISSQHDNPLRCLRGFGLQANEINSGRRRFAIGLAAIPRLGMITGR